MVVEQKFDKLRNWYTLTWSYLNTYFDDTRWMQPGPMSNDREEMFTRIQDKLAKLRPQLDPLVSIQLEAAYEKLEALIQQGYTSEYNDAWKKRAQDFRAHVQDRALEYGELAARVTLTK